MISKDSGISRSVRYVFNYGSVFSETAARNGIDLLRDAVSNLGDDPDPNDHRLYINAHNDALSIEFGNDSVLKFRKEGTVSILVPKSCLKNPDRGAWMISRTTEQSAKSVSITLPWMTPYHLPTSVHSAWMTCLREKAAQSGSSTKRQSVSDKRLSDQLDWWNKIMVDEHRDSMLRLILATRTALGR